MAQAWKTLIALTLGLGLVPATGQAQSLAEVEEVAELPTKQGPTIQEWKAAGLRPEEYALAIRWEVSIDQWKEMHQSRTNRRTAGYACIGVGVLGGGVVTTIFLVQEWDLKEHPEMEVFAISMVGVGAIILTGIVLAAGAPGPEDFRRRWREENGVSFDLGGATLTPGPLGMTLTF